MAKSLKMLVLGSKEYPVGSGSADKLGSGGFETFTQNLALHLAKLGQKPIILTRLFSGQKKHEVSGGVEVCRLRWIPGFFLRTPSFNFFSMLKSVGLDYDVAIASGIFAPLAAQQARSFNGKPVIVRPAGFGFRQPQYASLVQNALKRLQRKACFNADAVVFLSAEERKNFLDYFGSLPENSVVIKTGVAVPSFDRRRIWKIERQYGGAGVKRISFVGRLVETKGVNFLLDALEGLPSSVHLLLLGEGPLKQKFEARVSSNPELKGRVHFLGYRKNALEFVKASDVFVLPSLSEGLPISLLEALACGTPCVATDIGLPVQNGKTALVVPPGDALALRKAIEKVLKDKKLSSKLSSNGLSLVKKEFSWKKAANAYLNLALKLVK